MPVSRLLPLLLAVMLLCACSVSTPADGVPAEQGTSPASPAPQQLVLPYVSEASLNPLSTTSRINQELGALLFDPDVYKRQGLPSASRRPGKGPWPLRPVSTVSCSSLPVFVSTAVWPLSLIHFSRHLRQESQLIGMIFQSFNLLMQRTALQNVCFPLELVGTPKERARKRAMELLDIVGLSDRDVYKRQSLLSVAENKSSLRSWGVLSIILRTSL